MCAVLNLQVLRSSSNSPPCPPATSVGSQEESVHRVEKIMLNAITFKRLAFLYQMVLGASGVAAAILSLTLLVTTPIIALAPQSILVGGLVLGILLLFATLLGAVGTLNERNKAALVGCMVLMVALLGVTIVGAASIGKNSNADVVRAHLDQLWNTTQVATALQIQTWGQCCGFDSYADRIQEPCTKYQQEVGCFEMMRAQYSGQLHVLIVPATLLLVGECIGLVLNAIVMWLTWREGRQAKLIGDRQPFDAWHKAVFQ